MKTDVMPDAILDDARLVELGRGGNREAFGQLVARYQSPICALAYSACGDIARSEDLTQETFIVAWKKLGDLKEPARFRAWLYGIARNMIHGSFRKESRNPLAGAEPLDESAPIPAVAANPAGVAMSREEQGILWRSLEQIPETYREPLVLFYREHESIERVAEVMELSEEAARQRLSRGRKLLHEQVTAFVENALRQTGPGPAFTAGVLAALPLTLASSAKAATVAAAAAKGGATVTGTGLTVLGILSGPALGFLAGFLGWREGLRNTKTPQERALVKRYGAVILGGGILFFAACSLFSGYVTSQIWQNHPALVFALFWAMAIGWAVFAFGYSWWHQREIRRVREEAQQQQPGMFQDELWQPWEYRSRATLFGLPLVHWVAFNRVRRPGEKVPPAIGWIAFGERAYGILYASGGVAVGGVATGGFSIGLLSFGGVSLGLLAFGGLAVGAIALGGGAIGMVASGGLALAWHAAQGGMVVAHDLACGRAAFGNHVNDSVAREFFIRHHWLDFTQAGPRELFWLLCFGPIFIQMLIWIWWRRKMSRPMARN